MQLIAIEAGTLKLDGGAMFGVVPKSIWNKVYPADENNLITLAMRCLLIICDGRKILVDTGLGDKQDEKFFSIYQSARNQNVVSALATHGISADEITDVILTHLHFDHVGGAVKVENGVFKPTFPNAKYHISKQQWDWTVSPNRREKASYLKENIFPLLENQVINFVNQNCELFKGIEIRLFDGHTEGQMLSFIDYQGTNLVYCGDVIPTMAHLPVPYIMSYDIRPLVSLDEREKLVNEACANNYILFFEHDFYHQACTLQQTPKGIRENQTVTL